MARILIVDDSPTQTLSLAKILKKHGHEIITAKDGALTPWVIPLADDMVQTPSRRSSANATALI